jgi:hypothetical protein
MATYVNNLRLKEIATGDESGTWGTSTNTNLELVTDGFSYGTKEIAADANETFTMPDATADATRSLYLKFTSAVSLTATREITLGPNTVSKTWIIENATTGSQIITIKQGSGATVNVANGSKVMIVTDGAGAGAAVLNANPTEVGGTVTSVGGTGTVNGITLTGTVTSSGNLTLGGTLANVDLTSQVTGTLPIANGGTGSTSTTYVDLTTNVTGTLPIANGGTGSTSTTYVDLTTNVTGTLPVANGGTGITSFGSGVADFLGTPSSANLATAVTDETGSGALVFATGPTITGMTLAGAVTGADQTVSAINLKDYGEITNALGSVTGATSIDLTDGNSVTATVTGAVTWTFSNPTASDELCGFTLKLVDGGSAAQTWPASVDWPAATAPTLTASGTDVLVFITCDGGTTWYGFVAGLALA